MSESEYESQSSGQGSKSSDDKLMAALCYWGSIILAFIPALVIFLMKKDESAYLRKHSLQCLLFNIFLWVAYVVVGMITFGLGGLLLWLVSIALFGVWGYKVFQGEDIDIPVLSDMIAKNLSS